MEASERSFEVLEEAGFNPVTEDLRDFCMAELVNSDQEGDIMLKALLGQKNTTTDGTKYSDAKAIKNVLAQAFKLLLTEIDSSLNFDVHCAQDLTKAHCCCLMSIVTREGRTTRSYRNLLTILPVATLDLLYQQG